MGLLEKYKFTNKRHSLKAIMAVNLALIGIVTMVASVWLGYKNHGIVEPQHGEAVFLSVVMSVVGLGLSIAARMQPDRYRLFPNLGIVLNLLVLLGGVLILGFASG